MKNIKILHTADLHLDSAFEALPAGKAAIRRAEQRELLSRLAELARSERADIVLLAGYLRRRRNVFRDRSGVCALPAGYERAGVHRAGKS